MNCWHCNTELIWGGDHDLDDYEDMEYDIVTNLSCESVNLTLKFIIKQKNNYGFFKRHRKGNRG